MRKSEDKCAGFCSPDLALSIGWLRLELGSNNGIETANHRSVLSRAMVVEIDRLLEKTRNLSLASRNILVSQSRYGLDEIASAAIVKRSLDENPR